MVLEEGIWQKCFSREWNYKGNASSQSLFLEWDGSGACGRRELCIYSGNAIASASMLTGNIPLRHGMSDNTYQSEQVFDPDFDESLKAYPGFFSILLIITNQ